jgi:hypothetical protein
MLGERWNWITRIWGWRRHPVIGIALVRMLIPPISTAILDMFRNTGMESSVDGSSSSRSAECCTTARCGVRIWRVECFLVIVDRSIIRLLG